MKLPRQPCTGVITIHGKGGGGGGEERRGEWTMTVYGGIT